MWRAVGGHQLNGQRLNVIESGEGHPLVLLHPLAGSWRSWEPQLLTLAPRLRCVAVDLPGFGASPRGQKDFTFDALADVVAELCAVLDIGHTYVAGVSMGGMVAQALAVRHPDLVDAVALVNTSCWSDPALAGAVGSATEMIREYGLGAFVDIGAAASWSPAAATDQRDLVRRYAWEESSTDPEVYADALEAVAALDHRDKLAGMKAPTLVVRGGADGWMGPEHAEGLLRAIPDAELALLPGAGHLVNLEAPEAFNDVLVRFLDAHPCAR